jgi:esterase FrsA
VLGGPAEAAFTGGPPRHFGMAGIAMGFDEPPSLEELVERRKALSLRPLLNQDHNAPMLVIDGADDVHVPQHDTLVFQGRRDTMVELIPGTGHCAASKLPQAMATIADWLEHTLAAATTRVALR